MADRLVEYPHRLRLMGDHGVETLRLTPSATAVQLH